MKRPYQKVFCAGTFDHFHAGHRAMLRAGFEQSDFVVVGITTKNNPVVKGKEYQEYIQPLHERLGVLRTWLDHEFGADRYEIMLLDDTYDKTILHDPELEATVVCYKSGEHPRKINAIREEGGFVPLELIESPLPPEDAISSTDIRENIARAKADFDNKLEQNRT